MISTVWRVTSEHFDVKGFIEKNKLEPDAVFVTGFNLCLFETSQDNFLINFGEIMHDYEDVFLELQAQGIESQIDIGVPVGTADHYTISIPLSPTIMKKLSELNIEIVFSAYPASD